ncbi:hypothetical protein ACIF83_16885 [Streptomyces sp. NPDC085866]
MKRRENRENGEGVGSPKAGGADTLERRATPYLNPGVARRMADSATSA